MPTGSFQTDLVPWPPFGARRNRLSPDTMWVNSQEVLNISRKILSGSQTAAQRFIFRIVAGSGGWRHHGALFSPSLALITNIGNG
jgi:predicted RNA methylase